MQGNLASAVSTLVVWTYISRTLLDSILLLSCEHVEKCSYILWRLYGGVIHKGGSMMGDKWLADSFVCSGFSASSIFR